MPSSRVTTVYYIDQATYHVKEIHVSEPGRTQTVVITQYLLNAPIPDSEFTFTPPPGVKQVDRFAIGDQPP